MTAKRAVLIAVDRYERLSALPSVRADVAQLADLLGASQIGGYEVTTLLNPSRLQATNAIDELFRAGRDRNDQPLLYFTGHGLRGASGQLFLAMAETDPSRPEATAISAEYLAESMLASSAGNTVTILDCCYSGALTSLDVLRSETSGIDLAANVNRAVIAFSTAFQPAYWDPDGGTSLFTRVLISGLQGAADLNRDGFIDVNELYSFASGRFRDIAPEQTPVLATVGGGSPTRIAMIRQL